MRFAETDFPREVGIFDRGERRRAGAAVVVTDGDDVGACFGDACGDDADACAAHQFYADACAGIYGAQVVNELGKVFDAVDVVVRRRRNQGSAGSCVADARDVLGDFASGELAAFAGLGALGHFDFELLGMNQIIGRDTKATGGDLLYFVGRGRLEAIGVGIFAAFAGVAAAADHVHGKG